MNLNCVVGITNIQDGFLNLYTWVIDNRDALTSDEINNADIIIKQVCAELLKLAIEPLEANCDAYIESCKQYFDLVLQLNQKSSIVSNSDPTTC